MMSEHSSANALQVRDARPDELDEVAGLMRDAYLQYRDSLPAEAWEGYQQDIMDVRSRLRRSVLIVAELKGKPAGAVTLFLKGSGSAGEGWPRGWAGIRLLAVPPAYRGHGIGRALMEECIRRCRAKGVRTIGLHTSEMMAAAVHIYEGMGFKRAPEHDFHPVPGVTIMAYCLDL